MEHAQFCLIIHLRIKISFVNITGENSGRSVHPGTNSAHGGRQYCRYDQSGDSCRYLGYHKMGQYFIAVVGGSE